MKLEQILELWEEDSHINKNELGDEAIKIPKLHSKYYRIYVNEKLVLRKYKAELDQLRLEKYEFYTQGPTKEQMDLGWKLPASGKILKNEVNSYLDADKEIVEKSLKIGLQNEKVDLLESIIKSLTSRGFNLNVAVSWERFKVGV